MILRGYQTLTVKKAKAALKKKKNTLLVLPTGAGKTIIMSALAGSVGGKTLIIQHRQELLEQNMAKFRKINPDWKVSIFDATSKSMAGDCVFAMAQTLTRNLDCLPVFDHVLHDECHTIMAPTFARTIEACKDKNSKLLLTGVSATPSRGDKKSLRKFFNNVGHQVSIKELVSLGFLVPPRAFVVDIGVQNKLNSLGKQSGYGDQRDVEAILDTRPIADEIIRHWKEKAHDRQTVIFCSTVRHAEDMAKAFMGIGISSACVHGDLPNGERRKILQDYDRGNIQVITNVAVLTEGWDHQPTSCVILLRLCSERGPMAQMIGRALRTVDPSIYPGVVKRDALILDFGTSLLTHGNLDQEDGLHEEKEPGEKGEAVTKVCPDSYEPGMSCKFPDRNGMSGCGAELPPATRVCPICGFIFEREGFDPVQTVDLSELDIINASPFRWHDVFQTDTCLMASGFSAWAGVFSPDQGETWIALGKRSEERDIHKLAVTGRLQAIAMADDFLRNFETGNAAKKSKRWLDEPASEKQLAVLARFGYSFQRDFFGYSGMTKYAASCITNFFFNQRMIEHKLGMI